MQFKIFLLLISYVLSNITLYIKNIYLSDINFKKMIINDFIMNLDVEGKNIPKNIIINNIFDIILESENINEKEQKIIFECNFFGPNEIINSYIQCLLKETISSNLKGPFYFREEYFEKSFSTIYQKELLFFSLEILETTYCFGMIRSFLTIKSSFNLEFNYKNSEIKIPIAMGLDDGYTYPTIVAITSIMENSYKKTKYDYYLMIPPDFSDQNKKKIKSLEEKYNRCSIKFINMTNNFIFKNATISRKYYRMTTPCYYRLVLSDLLPHIEKIIYLDGDILSFIDLKEMYIIDMNGLYYRGFLDIVDDPFNPTSDIYICSGVMLINLEELRKDDMVNKMYKFMLKHNNELIFQDQTIINAVGYPKLGILPSKYGVFNFNNFDTLYFKTRTYKYKYKYTKNELREAYYNPKILHFNKNKPWKKRNNHFLKLLWKYAKKTDYYNEMNKIFKQKHKKKKKKIKKNKKKNKKLNFFI